MFLERLFGARHESPGPGVLFGDDPAGRVCIFSDLHGRLDLLELLAGAEPGARLLCLGDVLGARGDNAACVRWIEQRRIPCVRGNHEVDLFAVYEPTLDAGAVTAVRSWPLERAEENAFLTHCLVRDPAAPRPGFLEVTLPDRAEQVAGRTDRPVTFVGHTHLPGWWEGAGGHWTWTPVYREASLHLRAGSRFVVNVGSLGEPRAPQKPCYVCWTASTLEFRRLDG